MGLTERQFCQRNHLMAETRIISASGRKRCRKCAVIISQEWAKANQDKVLKTQRKKCLKKKYGLSLIDYETKFTAQNGKCAICGSNPDGKALAVDHCHRTGKIRGLLCGRCNSQVLVVVENYAELLEKAALYLQCWK